jgi:hypothetical protein
LTRFCQTRGDRIRADPRQSRRACT